MILVSVYAIYKSTELWLIDYTNEIIYFLLLCILKFIIKIMPITKVLRVPSYLEILGFMVSALVTPRGDPRPAVLTPCEYRNSGSSTLTAF